jgi:hypothetical protein
MPVIAQAHRVLSPQVSTLDHFWFSTGTPERNSEVIAYFTCMSLLQAGEEGLHRREIMAPKEAEVEALIVLLGFASGFWCDCPLLSLYPPDIFRMCPVSAYSTFSSI